MTQPIEQLVELPGATRSVSGILLRPAAAHTLFVLAHGAGAGMRHKFMNDLALALANRSIATLRYQFPYVENGSKRPDPQPVLETTVRRVVEHAHSLMPGVPVVAGGKSMGGRMTSNAAASGGIDARAIIFVGFPLHPPGGTSDARAEHLARVAQPMLFLQGTRDTLADLDRIRRVCAGLGDKARLHVVDGADHGFHVLKRSGRDDAAVLEELADVTHAFVWETLMS